MMIGEENHNHHCYIEWLDIGDLYNLEQPAGVNIIARSKNIFFIEAHS